MSSTEWRPQHNVCTVIWRHSPSNGQVEFVVVESRTKFKGVYTDWRVKFPGGGQEGPNEPVEGTRDREVWQETHLSFLRSEKIWENPVTPEHTQYGYLVHHDDCSGELRKGLMHDNGEEDELKEPRWELAETLGRSLFSKHQALYMRAMEVLRKRGIL